MSVNSADQLVIRQISDEMVSKFSAVKDTDHYSDRNPFLVSDWMSLTEESGLEWFPTVDTGVGNQTDLDPIFDLSVDPKPVPKRLANKRGLEVLSRGSFNMESYRPIEPELDLSHIMSRPKARLYGLTGVNSDSVDLPRTLKIENLLGSITKTDIRQMYSDFGAVIRVVLRYDLNPNLRCAYVQFEDHKSARHAHHKTDHLWWLGCRLRVSWNNTNEDLPYDRFIGTTDVYKHYIVLVDETVRHITKEYLRSVFDGFGLISYTSVSIDSFSTRNGKSFGFVHFCRRADAERAVNKMNGPFIKCSLISSNGFCIFEKHPNWEPMDVKYVQNLTNRFNRTIHCTGLKWKTCHQSITIIFQAFGPIKEILILTDEFSSRQSALIKFETNRSAALAITATNGVIVFGEKLNVFWSEYKSRKQIDEERVDKEEEGEEDYDSYLSDDPFIDDNSIEEIIDSNSEDKKNYYEI